MTSDKPLPITKRMLWEAYQLVAGEWKSGRRRWSEPG